jgi:hypothetical protein
MIQKVSCLLLLYLCFSFKGYSQNRGNKDYEILNTQNPARIIALGGNANAVKDGDLNLAIYNPALLDSNCNNQITFNYANYLADINFGQVGFAKTFKNVGTFHATIQNIGYGDFILTNSYGQSEGNFKAGEYVFSVGGGKPLDSLFSIGANLKFIYSELEQYKSTAIAADLAGVYCNPKNRLTATVMLRNIGAPMSHYTENEKEVLPFEIQFGISKKLGKAPLRFGLILENLQKWDLTYQNPSLLNQVDPLTGDPIEIKEPGFGKKFLFHTVINTEVLITKNFHLRFGYNYRRRQELKLSERPATAGITYGLGFRISKFHLSYGHSTFNLGAGTNHISIALKFADFKKKTV